MKDKFDNIDSAEINVNKHGDVELSEELTNAIAGGFNPEEEENEGDTNNGCKVINKCCGEK